jgi:replication factor C subunit 2/4
METLPWAEKYRPNKIEDLVLDECLLKKIKKIIEEKDMPNIIITGVPGVGKTTTILCIAKQVLGKYFDQAVLELNASDERGIKTVQESIIYFCKKKMNYTNHKIVLLDEADNMTIKAQILINGLMETYHKTTRFAFTCNNSSDIIEAIQSRCIILRYARLSNMQIATRLKYICKQENVDYTEDGLDAIILNAQGDLRKAVNSLQIVVNGYKHVTEDNVLKLCDTPHPIAIKSIFTACCKKDLKEALTLLNELRVAGYSSSDLCISMINTLKTVQVDEETKIRFMEDISKTYIVISKGLDRPLQLTGCIARLCKKN